MLIHTVLKKPLALFSQKPMTGFYRDGYCRVGPEDGGNHAVAGTFGPRLVAPFPSSPSARLALRRANDVMLFWGGIAGVLTKEFLDFSASRGNNLRSIGLEAGCKWCLCTARWYVSLRSKILSRCDAPYESRDMLRGAKGFPEPLHAVSLLVFLPRRRITDSDAFYRKEAMEASKGPNDPVVPKWVLLLACF